MKKKYLFYLVAAVSVFIAYKLFRKYSEYLNYKKDVDKLAGTTPSFFTYLKTTSGL